MGCDCLEELNRPKYASIFIKIDPIYRMESKKDGLDIYYHDNYYFLFFQSNQFICPICKDEFTEDEVNKIKSLKRNDIDSFEFIFHPKEETMSEYERLLDALNNMIEEEEKYLKTLYYKYKCIKTNQEIYLRLYFGRGKSFGNYVYYSPRIFMQVRYLLSKIRYFEKKNANYDDNYDDGKITENGYFRGKKLCGKVQVVDNFPDFKVQVVKNFPDLKVQKVKHFPNEIGQWQFVDSFPDFTIQYVDYFPDFKIQFVDHFPGVC